MTVTSVRSISGLSNVMPMDGPLVELATMCCGVRITHLYEAFPPRYLDVSKSGNRIMPHGQSAQFNLHSSFAFPDFQLSLVLLQVQLLRPSCGLGKSMETESRVQYAPDLETTSPRAAARRKDSYGSLSRRSSFSGRVAVDPDVILPVGYRTL